MRSRWSWPSPERCSPLPHQLLCPSPVLVSRLTERRCILQCQLYHQIGGGSLQLQDQVFLLMRPLDQLITPLGQLIAAEPCGPLTVILHHRLPRQAEIEIDAEHGDRSKF